MTITDLTEKYADEAAEISRMSFSDPWNAGGILSYINEENSVCLAAFENDKLSGYILGSSDGDTAWTDSIAVHKNHRRKGTASALLSAFSERVKNIPITLEVRESNLPAQELYKKFGFKTAGIRKNMYSSPRENAVVMIFEGSENNCLSSE